MRQANKRRLLFLLIGLVLLTGLCMPAAAAGFETKLEIPVTSQSGGRVHMEALDGAPDPGQDTVTLKEGETKNFLLRFTEPDTWAYLVWQEETDSNEEDRVYLVTVMVQSSDSGLSTVYTIEADDQKTDAILFGQGDDGGVLGDSQEPIVSRKGKRTGAKAGGVQTGDFFAAPYALLGAAAVGGLIMVLIRRKKGASWNEE